MAALDAVFLFIPTVSIDFAIPPRVGYWKIDFTVSLRSLLNAEESFMAERESPPIAKKFESGWILSTSARRVRAHCSRRSYSA